MRLFVLLAAWLCCSAAVSQAASLRRVGQLPGKLADVQFASPEAGWCRTLDGLFRTADGGRTWMPVRTPGDAMLSRPWWSQLLTPAIGWVRMHDGPFYSTRNGGETWTKIHPPRRVFIQDLEFATGKIGWAFALQEVPGDPTNEIRYRVASEKSVYVPVLFRTRDGALTWTKQPYPDIESFPYRLSFADVQHGISIELNATLFTRDGGKSWRKSRYCADVNRDQIKWAEIGSDTFKATPAQLLDAEYGWWSVEGDLFRTTDGGATWCQLPSIQWHEHALAIQQLHFTDRRQGCAIPSNRGGTGFRCLASRRRTEESPGPLSKCLLRQESQALPRLERKRRISGGTVSSTNWSNE